jgi:hypothetical protein
MTAPPPGVVAGSAAEINPDVTFTDSSPQVHLSMMPPLADREIAGGPTAVVTPGGTTPPDGSPEPQMVEVALEDLPGAVELDPEEPPSA